MKRILKISLIVILAIVLILAGIIGYYVLKNKQKFYPRIIITELNLSAQEREDDFLEICEILKDKNSFVTQRLDFDALSADYLSQVKATTNSIDYGMLLVKFFAELKNGHTSIQFNRYTANCFATIIENRIFVESIRNQSLNYENLTPKDEILAVNGIPVNDWIASELPYSEGSTSEYQRLIASYRVFSSYTDTVRTFKIRNSEGERDVEVKLYKDIQTDGNMQNVEGKMLNNSVAYLAIKSMNGKEIFSQFLQAYQSLKNSLYIIIDVRENGGGNSGTSEKITEYFITQPQKACVSGWELEPVADAFKGKVYLLTSTNTFSAAESFVIDLKESGNVTLIGEPTGGDTGNRPVDFQTSHGIVFRIPVKKEMQISPQGFPMEGVGVEPHHFVHQTAEDFLADKDTVLEYVLELLTK